MNSTIRIYPKYSNHMEPVKVGQKGQLIIIKKMRVFNKIPDSIFDGRAKEIYPILS